MRLPKDLLAKHFDSSFKRGTVIKFLMTDPNDPTITSRYKYALIVGLDGAAPDSFLLLTTSKVDKLEAIRKRIPAGFHDFAVGDYAWVSLPTVLDLRNVRCYPRDELVEKMNQGSLTFEGLLTEAEMNEIDEKLRVSKTIELKTLRKIVTGIT